jgi:glycosyl transferase family 2
VLRQAHRGVAAARNLGLFHARSEFVIVSHADDVMLPQSIETLAAFAAARPDLDILAANGYVAKEGTTVATWCKSRDSKAMFPLGDQRMGIVNDNLLPGNAAVRRQRLVGIGGFDESIGVAEDYDAWARLIFAGSRAGLVLEPLQIFRPRSSSSSHNEVGAIDGRITVLTKLAATHDLTSAEYAAARARIGEYRSSLVRATSKLEARAALIHAQPDVRRRCFRVAMQKGHGLHARSKALAATLAPTWARRHAHL